MNNISLYKVTQNIIEEVELSILNNYSYNKFIVFFNKHMIFPIKYILLGSKDFFQPVIKWSFLSFILIIFVGYLLKFMFIDEHELAIFLFGIVIFLSMILVTFSMPSTYAYYGIEDDNIKHIVKIIKNNYISNINGLEILEKNIEIIYERVLGKIKAFKWIVGVYWMFFTFIESRQLFIAKQLNYNPIVVIENSISKFIVNIIITLIAIWLISSYKRASDFLFKGVFFAINEYKYEIQQK